MKILCALLIVFGALIGCAKTKQTVFPDLVKEKPVIQKDTVQETIPVAPPPIEPPEVIPKFENVYFDFDESTLRQDAVKILLQMASFLKSKTSVTVKIYGYCDDRGSSDYNMALGLKRAEIAKKWLVSAGIPGNRISTSSYGKEHPVEANCTDDPCHQKNRRDEFILE